MFSLKIWLSNVIEICAHCKSHLVLNWLESFQEHNFMLNFSKFVKVWRWSSSLLAKTSNVHHDPPVTYLNCETSYLVPTTNIEKEGWVKILQKIRLNGKRSGENSESHAQPKFRIGIACIGLGSLCQFPLTHVQFPKHAHFTGLRGPKVAFFG